MADAGQAAEARKAAAKAAKLSKEDIKVCEGGW